MSSVHIQYGQLLNHIESIADPNCCLFRVGPNEVECEKVGNGTLIRPKGCRTEIMTIICKMCTTFFVKCAKKVLLYIFILGNRTQKL